MEIALRTDDTLVVESHIRRNLTVEAPDLPLRES